MKNFEQFGRLYCVKVIGEGKIWAPYSAIQTNDKSQFLYQCDSCFEINHSLMHRESDLCKHQTHIRCLDCCSALAMSELEAYFEGAQDDITGFNDNEFE